jgi:hypothetical protein
LAEVRQRLIQAQQLAKKYYDANHREVEFGVCVSAIREVHGGRGRRVVVGTRG